MAKPYTIRDAIGELDTIRMEVSTLANRIPSISGNPGVTLTDLYRLVSELSSVMLWFVRHVDRLEEGLYEGPELLPPELQEVTNRNKTTRNVVSTEMQMTNKNERPKHNG